MRKLAVALVIITSVSITLRAEQSLFRATKGERPVTHRRIGSEKVYAPEQRTAMDEFARLPLVAQATISSALGRDDPAYGARASGRGFLAENRRHALEARFSARSVEIRSRGARFGLALRAWGYGEALEPVAAVAPRATANRVSYPRGTTEEWYANGPLGLEQGFTLASPPQKAGLGPLTLALTLSGTSNPALDRDGHGLSFAGSSLRYRSLAASDATGRELPARLELHNRTLLLRVDDSGARYPIMIDPFVQQAKLTASDGAAVDELGSSVAASADTIVATAPFAEVGANRFGAVYVFVKPVSGWANSAQTAKLTASDGVASDLFANSVAVSGDTVVAGAPQATAGSNAVRGAAYVFVKPASGWANATETAKLTASDGAFRDLLGESVAVSGDTVVAGALGANADQGAAYVFIKPVSGWANATQMAKLTASDGASLDSLGISVAVSGDTVVAGATHARVGPHLGQGAAYVFVKPTLGWASGTETAKLTASDGAVSDQLGVSIAVSGDTVVAGAQIANQRKGAAYVFVKPASGWASATQTAKLAASDGAFNDLLGDSVAVSGNTVVAGAFQFSLGEPGFPKPGAGAAYVFVKPAVGWTSGTETAKLIATDGVPGDFLGNSVAVSGDTVVAGAPGAKVGANVGQGAAYAFNLSTDLIGNLIGNVNALGLPKGNANSFIVKLNQAIAAVNAGDTATACIDLQDFINEVNAQTQPPRSKLLTPAQAQSLINLALQIKALIGCP